MPTMIAPRQVERWGIYEMTLQGPAEGNPFRDVTVSARFRHSNRVVEVEGFYDGNGVYRVRLMPDAPGDWEYQTASNVGALDGISGSFSCVAPSSGNHGPVVVRDRYHFSYADGTPYVPVGTTCYVWTHQPEELQQQTLATLSRSPFNKLRMCVFPKHYRFNENEPERYPFPCLSRGTSEWTGSWQIDEREGWSFDFSQFDPAFFQHFEQRVADLLALGIEADIILFHPYDRWGFAALDSETDERYLRYVIARLAAYRNIWWSLANEYDLMQKSMARWDRLFQIVQERDPAQHLRSIHNWQSLLTHDTRTFYDHGKPWVTHCSVQHGYVDLVDAWREQYRKPIVVDETCYEGDLPNGWGNITAEDMTRRFWEGAVRGGYVGHGETYLHPEDVIWWAKGGALYGQSPGRIAFLRQVLEEADGPLDPVGEATDTHITSGGRPGEYYLTYFGVRQPGRVTLKLPAGERYRADLLDTWEMTTTLLAEAAEDRATLRLPRKPYLALRLRRVR